MHERPYQELHNAQDHSPTGKHLWQQLPTLLLAAWSCLEDMMPGRPVKQTDVKIENQHASRGYARMPSTNI